MAKIANVRLFRQSHKNTVIALDFSLLLVAERIRLHRGCLKYSDSLYFWDDESCFAEKSLHPSHIMGFLILVKVSL
jgi:hypothetical protein